MIRILGCLLVMMLISLSGCSEDPRIYQMAQQSLETQRQQNEMIAKQSQTVAEQSSKLAEASRSLVAEDLAESACSAGANCVPRVVGSSVDSAWWLPLGRSATLS